MKKLLLSFIAALGFATAANAQLTEGTVFPYPGGATGGLTAVNTPFTGIRYNLDSLSNAGYTIFIDISATWCPPCWAYHNSKQLDTLWNLHGPAGSPGVSSSTTNDVFVIFVQGEATSHLAEFYGDYADGAVLYSTTELPYSTVTQGDWVAGTPFPMVDDTTSTDPNYGTASIDAAWNIAFFPTVYMVCRDHLVHNLTQPSYTDAYAAATADCPSYAPSTTIDAKATAYTGTGYYVCTATPTVTFQNYSATNSITSATVTVTNASGTTVATAPWTGTLAPYELATVSIPGFAGTSLGGYKYSVNVTGDSRPSNNVSVDSIFKVYDASNAATLPFSENFDELSSVANVPYSETNNSPDGYGVLGYWDASEVGPDGSASTAFSYIVITPYVNTGTVEEYILGNFNTAGDKTSVAFDVSYAQQTTSTNDKLEVNVSSDCGDTWTTVYSKSGSALSTTSPDNTTYWEPTASTDWRRDSVSFATPSGSNTMIKFDFTAEGGNDFFLDQIYVSGVTDAVTNIAAVNNNVSVYPNPTSDVANVSFTLQASGNVTIEVIDALGRVVNTTQQEFQTGNQKAEISTSDLSTGLYSVKVIIGNSVTTKQLTVIK